MVISGASSVEAEYGVLQVIIIIACIVNLHTVISRLFVPASTILVHLQFKSLMRGTIVITTLYSEI
jgi:hypothetical protein